jgi:flagellar hook assembly protein FlgD
VFDPRRQLLWIRFRTSVRATDEIQVRTAGWRVVRTKALGSLSAAGHAADWRGRNDAGRMLPPGRYWVRFCATAGDLRIAGLWHEVTLL